MTDVCTIIATAFSLAVPANLCLKTECSISADGGRQLCINSPTACKAELPAPQYLCRREDGSTYVWTDDRK